MLGITTNLPDLCSFNYLTPHFTLTLSHPWLSSPWSTVRGGFSAWAENLTLQLGLQLQLQVSFEIFTLNTFKGSLQPAHDLLPTIPGVPRSDTPCSRTPQSIAASPAGEHHSQRGL